MRRSKVVRAAQWAGHSKEAARQLQRLVVRDPNNALAWRSLGMAEVNLQHFGAGISALRIALALDGQAPRTLYQLGIAYALAGDLDSAFKWLGAARATGRYDMTELAGDARLAALRADTRYAGLLPGAEDFEPPFVEPTTIIRESRASIRGLTAMCCRHSARPVVTSSLAITSPA